MKQYRKRILIILGVLSLLVITGSCFFLLLKPSQKPKELEYLMGTARGKSDFQLYLKIVCSKPKSNPIFGIIFKKHWKRDAL